MNMVENSEFYFLGDNRLEKHVSDNQRPVITFQHETCEIKHEI